MDYCSPGKSQSPTLADRHASLSDRYGRLANQHSELVADHGDLMDEGDVAKHRESAKAYFAKGLDHSQKASELRGKKGKGVA